MLRDLGQTIKIFEALYYFFPKDVDSVDHVNSKHHFVLIFRKVRSIAGLAPDKIGRRGNNIEGTNFLPLIRYVEYRYVEERN